MLLQSGVAQLAKLSEQCKDALASKGSSDPMDMSIASMWETTFHAITSQLHGLCPSKSVSVHCRVGYPKLAKVGEQFVDALATRGSSDPVDMSMACMCETIDALGHVGFDKAYHNVESVKHNRPAQMLNASPQSHFCFCQYYFCSNAACRRPDCC